MSTPLSQRLDRCLERESVGAAAKRPAMVPLPLPGPDCCLRRPRGRHLQHLRCRAPPPRPPPLRQPRGHPAAARACAIAAAAQLTPPTRRALLLIECLSGQQPPQPPASQRRCAMQGDGVTAHKGYIRTCRRAQRPSLCFGRARNKGCEPQDSNSGSGKVLAWRYRC